MSTLAVNTIQSQSSLPPVVQNNIGTEVGQFIRAKVNFNGAASPITIREALNVSSITDNGVGDYTINFATALPTANYTVVCTSTKVATNSTHVMAIHGDPATLRSTTQIRVRNNTDAGVVDTTDANIIVG